MLKKSILLILCAIIGVQQCSMYAMDSNDAEGVPAGSNHDWEVVKDVDGNSEEVDPAPKFGMIATVGKYIAAPLVGMAGTALIADRVLSGGKYIAAPLVGMAEAALAEGKSIAVPFFSALANIVQGTKHVVIAGGRLVVFTTKLGVTCVYVFSKGSVRLFKFGNEHPELVAGIALGAGAFWLFDTCAKKIDDWYYAKFRKKTEEAKNLLKPA